MSQEQILKISPTQDQWTRFIIWHCHTYVNGSSFRREEFARQLSEMNLELQSTGSITLVDKYMIEDWQELESENFVLGTLVTKPSGSG